MVLSEELPDVLDRLQLGGVWRPRQQADVKAQLPKLARYALRGLAAELEALGNRVKEVEAAILAWHKDNEASRRLATIPVIGPITASAIIATVTDC